MDEDLEDEGENEEYQDPPKRASKASNKARAAKKADTRPAAKRARRAEKEPESEEEEVDDPWAPADEEEGEEEAPVAEDDDADLQPKSLQQCYEVRHAPSLRARLPSILLPGAYFASLWRPRPRARTCACRSRTRALSRAVSFVCRPVRRSPQLSLPGDSMLLSISLDEWIRWYTQEPNAALVAYANFLVYAAGLRKVHLDLATVVGGGNDDPLDELFNDDNMSALYETAQANGTYLEPPPLADKKNGAHKKYRTLLIKLSEQLLEKVRCARPPMPARGLARALRLLRASTHSLSHAHARAVPTRSRPHRSGQARDHVRRGRAAVDHRVGNDHERLQAPRLAPRGE